MLDSTIGSANLHPINRFASTSGRLILLCHAELMKTPWKDARIELDPVDTQITELDAIFQKKKNILTFCAYTRNAIVTLFLSTCLKSRSVWLAGGFLTTFVVIFCVFDDDFESCRDQPEQRRKHSQTCKDWTSSCQPSQYPKKKTDVGTVCTGYMLVSRQNCERHHAHHRTFVAYLQVCPA